MIIDLNPVTLIITLNVNVLNLLVKRWTISDWITEQEIQPYAM